MIQPDAFLFFIGLSLARVLRRQAEVFAELANQFQGTTEKKDPKSNRKHFKSMLDQVNKDERFCNCLESWMPAKRGTKAAAAALLILGLLSEGRHFFESASHFLPSIKCWMGWIQVVVYLVVAAAVWKATDVTLEKRAIHPLAGDASGYLAIDMAAKEIVHRRQQEASEAATKQARGDRNAKEPTQADSGQSLDKNQSSQ